LKEVRDPATPAQGAEGSRRTPYNLHAGCL